MIRLFLSLLLPGLFILALPACATGLPSEYSAEPIEAQVIDVDTKKPVDGVIVTANWELRGGASPGGSTAVGQLMVMEAVTDKNGKFHFPAWGPKLRPPLTELHNRDPQLILFKSGYRYAILANEPRYMYQPETILDPVRRSDWNGKTIELKPFKGTVGEWAKHFESLNYDLEHIAADQPEECNWKKLPRTILAMSNERKVLEGKGINPHTLSSIDKELIMNDEYYTKKGKASCGSPKAFLRGIQQ